MSGLRAVLGIHAVSQPAGTSAAVSVAGQVCGLGWGAGGRSDGNTSAAWEQYAVTSIDPSIDPPAWLG